MSDDVDAGKKERGRRSPSFSLQDAVNFLTVIRQNLGEGTFSREAMAEALGHRGVTGAVTTKIGTLTHFGLLEREGSVYKIAAIGRRVLHPLSDADRLESLALAARSPVLYEELLKAFTGKPLPGMFANTLIHNFGILADNATEVARLFRQSMEFCSLLRNGILYITPTSTTVDGATSNAGSAKTDDLRSQVGPLVGSAVTNADSGTAISAVYQEYAIPLSKKRTAILRIPSPLADSDLQRITKWLAFFADMVADDSTAE